MCCRTGTCAPPIFHQNRDATHGEFDAALLFTQDSDIAEVVHEIVELREEMNRWMVVDCAFPEGTSSDVAGARPIPFAKALYDTCVDPTDYFPPPLAPKLPGVP